jgi:hypothetical protein
MSEIKYFNFFTMHYDVDHLHVRDINLVDDVIVDDVDSLHIKRNELNNS